MTIWRQVARTWQYNPIHQTLKSHSRARSSDLLNPYLLYHRGYFEHHYHSDSGPNSNANNSRKSVSFPVGVGSTANSYLNDPNKDSSKPTLPPAADTPPATASSHAAAADTPPATASSHAAAEEDVEETARKQRNQIEELFTRNGIRRESYARFTVAPVKGQQQVSIKFQLPQAGQPYLLHASIAYHIRVKLGKFHGDGSDSGLAWQLMLTPHPEKGKSDGSYDRDLRIIASQSSNSSNKVDIEFLKEGCLSPKELDALMSALRLGGSKLDQNSTSGRRPTEDTTKQQTSSEKLIESLESMGVKVYGTEKSNVSSARKEISWDTFAGYDQQKRDIEDTILLALINPQLFDDIARGTHRKYVSNRPRAVLFDGPPGTGKTSCARVIANQAGVPLIYVPQEVIMTKWYGEGTRVLGKIFSLANELPDGAIIFLDEIDSFATKHSGYMHEATRRNLSVLLRQIDGFEQDKKVIVVGATNRRQDLDQAMLSRFDTIITFGLPDEQNRKEIAAQHAMHLTESELDEFAKITEGMSGRDIKDVCQQAERSWASKIFREQVPQDGEQGILPPVQEYKDKALNRLSIVCFRHNNNPEIPPLAQRRRPSF